MINPYALRQLLEEAKLRYYDVGVYIDDEDDIFDEFCELAVEIAEDTFESAYE